MTTYIQSPRIRLTVLTAGILASAAMPAAADSIRLEGPMAAASLFDGGVDMVVYYLAHRDDFEVVATYALHDGHSDPARLRMGLSDGDRVSFGLPGVSGVSYTFSRAGALISVEATQTGRPTRPDKPELVVVAAPHLVPGQPGDASNAGR